MKKILLIVLGVMLFSVPAFAGPFLVCDPQAGVTFYKLTGPTWVPATSPAQADGSLKLDVSASNQGQNSLTVAACVSDPSWGEACSDFVPFVFSRLVTPGTPGNLQLVP